MFRQEGLCPAYSRRVTITCPNTGREISTGIETDAITFENLPDVLNRTHCPVCGLEHLWWKREAHLDGSSARAASRL